jgi:hypothetical protein
MNTIVGDGRRRWTVVGCSVVGRTKASVFDRLKSCLLLAGGMETQKSKVLLSNSCSPDDDRHFELFSLALFVPYSTTGGRPTQATHTYVYVAPLSVERSATCLPVFEVFGEETTKTERNPIPFGRVDLTDHHK